MMRAARLRGAVAACVLGAAAAASAAPVVVGMTLPLSGPDAPFGAALRDGAQLAVARANAAGGVAGRPIELALRDDGGDQRGEREAHGKAQSARDHSPPFTITRSSNSRVSSASLVRSNTRLSGSRPAAAASAVTRPPPR